MLRSIRVILLSSTLAVTGSIVSLTVTTESLAQSPADAKQYLLVKHNKVRSLLDSNTADKDSKIKAELQALIDYTSMAQQALGEYWPQRTEAERNEFKSILTQIIEKNYRKNLDKLRDYQVDYLNARVDGELYIVSTEATNLKDARADKVAIEYKLRKSSNDFIVVDFEAEGSSMVRTYQSQCKKTIEKDGWDALLNKMRNKLKD